MPYTNSPAPTIRQPEMNMQDADYAAAFLMAGIAAFGFCALWQMYVVLSESYTLNRYQNDSRKMLLAALAMFFSFSLAVYGLCPNARRKGIVFLLAGSAGAVCYGLGMWYKARALSGAF